MKWIFTLLAVWLLGGPLQARSRYWDVDYDSLARTLPQQRTDTARLRTLVHLLDLRPTSPQALPLLDQLLALNQRLQTLNADPYRRLRAGVFLWQRGNADAAALDSMKAAVASFDRLGRPIPWLLIDLVTLYNRLNRMDARRQYYEERLAYYRLHGPVFNVAACYISQGGYYRRMGDYNRTLNNILRAADLVQPYDHQLYVRELLVAGDVYADWNNRAKAVYYLRLAQRLPGFRRLQGLERVFPFLSLSRLYQEGRQYSNALRMADSALRVWATDPYEQQQLCQAYGLVRKSAVLLQMQQADKAGPLLARAQQLDDSLHLPMAGKPGEFELDATWAEYYAAQHNYALAETHWLLAYQKATAAKLERLRPKYLQQLMAFYDGRGRPAEAQRYSRAYIALADTFNAAQSTFHVAQYEGERVEQAQNTQIDALRQAQAVQAVRLRLGNWLLLGAGLAVLLVSGLGGFIYWQLRVNRRTLAQLQHTQSQLVQAEKMAFLGELTAGIAHELQNPLNFMKNFAEVSTDLVDDMHREEGRRDAGLEGQILVGLKQNLQQISQHGQRASSIIKDMLEHSRTGTGQRVACDLNTLADESLTLAYQGLCANDKTFQATLDKEFDPKLGPVAVVTQDLGRVLLNLCTNALYAVRQRQQEALAHATTDCPTADYEPTVTVSTHRLTSQAVEIRVRDNGIGMSETVKGKIFQPFFTTKPPGEGTGLGLSLSYDIVTKGHGGTLTVESHEGQGTEFLITLPV
jgi:two-component system NtrC family sensor kinase